MSSSSSTKDTRITTEWSSGKGVLPGRETIGPLFLMATTPAFSIVFFHVCANMNGDFLAFSQLCYNNGLFSTIHAIWPSPWDPQACKMIGSFLGFELLLQRFMPGKMFKATVTPQGNQPIYKANGMASYVFTLVTLLSCTHMGWIRPALVYDKFGEILSSMNVFALAFCTMLLIKGHVAPTNSDSGRNQNFIIDFYWGKLSHTCNSDN